jgi:hypothetical protein
MYLVFSVFTSRPTSLLCFIYLCEIKQECVRRVCMLICVLKMETLCTSETSVALPTSTLCRNSTAESLSEMNKCENVKSAAGSPCKCRTIYVSGRPSVRPSVRSSVRSSVHLFLLLSLGAYVIRETVRFTSVS